VKDYANCFNDVPTKSEVREWYAITTTDLSGLSLTDFLANRRWWWWRALHACTRYRKQWGWNVQSDYDNTIYPFSAKYLMLKTKMSSQRTRREPINSRRIYYNILLYNIVWYTKYNWYLRSPLSVYNNPSLRAITRTFHLRGKHNDVICI